MFSPQRNDGLTVVKILVGANTLLFFLVSMQAAGLQRWIRATFGLSWPGLQDGMLWQLLSYQFLHDSLLHLIVNMLGLWFAGKILEGLMGRWLFLIFYLTCGAVGGILQLLLSGGTLLIGASGSVFGVVCAFAALFPEMPIRALIFFVIPVNLKAKWLGRSLVAISLFFAVTGLGGNVGHAAHLGGALTGYAWVFLGGQKHIRVFRR